MRGPGYVYFVYSPATKSVKIGSTTNPVQRLKGLQTGCGDTLVPLHYIVADDAYETEHEFHRVCRPDHRQGEWFHLTGVLHALIMDLKGSAVDLSVGCPLPPPIPRKRVSGMPYRGVPAAPVPVLRPVLPKYTWEDVLSEVRHRTQTGRPFPLERLEGVEFSTGRPTGGGVFLIPKHNYQLELSQLSLSHLSSLQPHFKRRGSQDTAYMLTQATTLEGQLEVLLGALSHESQSSRTGLWCNTDDDRRGKFHLATAATEAMVVGVLRTHGRWHHASTGATLDFEMADCDSPTTALRCANLIYSFATYLAFNYFLVVSTPTEPDLTRGSRWKYQPKEARPPHPRGTPRPWGEGSHP